MCPNAKEHCAVGGRAEHPTQHPRKGDEAVRGTPAPVPAARRAGRRFELTAPIGPLYW